MLGSDQLDAETLQFGRRLLEELVGGFDVELDGRRAVPPLGERGEHVDLGGDRRRQLADRRLEEREVLRAGGHLDGERVARPHVGGAAPPPGIGLVDELRARHRHGSRRSSGTTRRRRRISTGSPRARWPRRRRTLGELTEGIDVGGPGGLDAGVLAGEGTKHQPDRGGRRRPVAGHDQAPTRSLAGGPRAALSTKRSKIVADDLPARDRVVRGDVGQADRRHRLGKGVEVGVDGRTGGWCPVHLGGDDRDLAERRVAGW